MAEPHRGLLGALEKVAEVGVLKPPGEEGRYGYWLDGLSGLYASCEYLLRSPAITRGGGRRLSATWLYVELTEPMLEADREFLWCPRMAPVELPAVEARDLLPGGRTRSLLTCR